MASQAESKAGHGVRDGLIVALIVLVCTFIGNVAAYTVNAKFEHSQASRQEVVVKTGEIWKGIVSYRTYLDKINQIKFGAFLTSSTGTPGYAKALIAARANALQAKQRLNKLIGDNSFYIGPTLTREASLYVSYLDGYYEQREQIDYSKRKPSDFELKMLKNTQDLLNQTGDYLTARSSYAIGQR